MIKNKSIIRSEMVRELITELEIEGVGEEVDKIEDLITAIVKL